MSQHCSKSQYATFEAMNGTIFTIRLVNHNTKVSNFDNHEDSEGISIVITSQKNNGVTNDGDAYIVEFFYDSIKIIERDTQNVPRLTKQKVENTFCGIWIDDVQEFAKFVSAVNNTPFEENGEGIAYTDNYFYAYYINIDGQVVPFASVYLNAEESQDVVSKYNQQTNESGEQRRVRGYLDRANAFARNIQSERNAEFSNNKSASNTRRNDSLGSDISRKGRYFDRPDLFVKTQRVDRFGLIEDYSRQGEGVHSVSARQRSDMVNRIQSLAEKLNIRNLEIVTDTSALEGNSKKSKGFFSKRTGKITIVLPNNSSIFDVEQTLLHEAVAHYGCCV